MKPKIFVYSTLTTVLSEYEFCKNVARLRNSPRLRFKYYVATRKENLQCDVGNERVKGGTVKLQRL